MPATALGLGPTACYDSVTRSSLYRWGKRPSRALRPGGFLPPNPIAHPSLEVGPEALPMLRTSFFAALLIIGSGVTRPACAAIEDEEPSVAGRKLSEWVQTLKTEKEEKQRRAALTALKYMGTKLETAKVVPPVALAARDDTSDAIRKAATQALGDL